MAKREKKQDVDIDKLKAITKEKVSDEAKIKPVSRFRSILTVIDNNKKSI